jgi:hypothetical protein
MPFRDYEQVLLEGHKLPCHPNTESQWQSVQNVERACLVLSYVSKLTGDHDATIIDSTLTDPRFLVQAVSYFVSDHSTTASRVEEFKDQPHGSQRVINPLSHHYG